jgi:ABC-2 type transport system ATP-binding protein
MIEVEHLTKRFAGRKAIDSLSFQVRRGEIVGFLGRNGAGKSTTMRILSCFLPPTSGRAFVAGYDIFRDSQRVRESIGYLPENVPLYPDMRVDEYLSYRGALKGLTGGKLRVRVGAVKDATDLREVGRSLIRNLSKGFRQRVGLADALIHDPPLLILDEPTSGLDPNQIRQVREFIKRLGGSHTILLSTHILPEVEMTCDRVVIIHKGRIAAIGTPGELPAQLRATGNVRVEIRSLRENPIPFLSSIHGVKDVEELVLSESTSTRPNLVQAVGSMGTKSDSDFRTYRILAAPGQDPRADIFQIVKARGWELRELSRHQPTLEDVFVELTDADA